MGVLICGGSGFYTDIWTGEEMMKPKKPKAKREGLLRIPLPFEEVISDVLRVKPERKRKPSKVGKR